MKRQAEIEVVTKPELKEPNYIVEAIFYDNSGKRELFRSNRVYIKPQEIVQIPYPVITDF